MTLEDVVPITGNIADRFLVEILELKPLPGELVEAVCRARGDDPASLPDEPASPRVARLAAILEAADAAATDPAELEELR